MYFSWFRKDDFSHEKATIWIKDSSDVKNVLMDFFIINAQLFASQDINWWTGIVLITCGLLMDGLYQLFDLSFWWHPFTPEDPPVMLNFSESNEETNSFTSWIAWGVSEYLADVHFCVNLSFQCNTAKYVYHVFCHTIFFSDMPLISINSLSVKTLQS